MQTIVFLDRGTLSVPLRKPAFPHVWLDHDRTSPEETVERLRGADIAVTNKVKLRETELAPLPHLQLIAVAATGYDGIDVAWCRAHGIRVSNVPGYTGASVPEHVFMLILALRRHLPSYRAAMKEGRWQTAPFFTMLDYPIQDVAGSTLGLIGYGQLAKEVEKRAVAFGMKILIAERKDSITVRPGRKPFLEVLRESDVISIHAPMTPGTRGLISSPELAIMKKEAILINTARGGIVDETALADALTAGRLGGAGIDVLSQEPPRDGNPLLNLKLPNLIITPHIAWTSRQAQEALAEEIVRNIEAFAAGIPRNMV